MRILFIVLLAIIPTQFGVGVPRYFNAQYFLVEPTYQFQIPQGKSDPRRKRRADQDFQLR